MKNKITIDMNMPPTERLKLLTELTREVRAEKKAEPTPIKVEMAKSYFSIPKELKLRFAVACEANSQNEVITDLIEKYTRQFERNKPMSSVETMPTSKNQNADIPSTSSPIQQVEEEGFMDMSEFLSDLSS